ncbi:MULTISPECIES: carboxypeptidase-like regulatory domain-containing protein [unclassified Lentimicrobium]|uniref:carboxypeptidase-like regulatory domain-containing protein n=1 Tax=unclassified Lentimicrobium TaxID=2677434 RepID=UPI0015557C9D|nr:MULTISPECIES: carboxypeptidase-like regulatory domain-containing protein [unclassified Lentimicrobium]NPD44793.1 hypothetical protein [Lentimicrobium sp. S6]NPD83190.1 hypothetical protein [Lentimicrobium sp. L6]
MNQRYYIIIFLLSLVTTLSQAQDRDKVLFSGVIVENDSLKPVSYANIIIVNKNLGTMSTIEGYFAFYAQEQDTIRFSALGFEPSFYIIPEMVETERYSIIQVLGRDTLELAETIIYPWPANERDFKESFIHDEIEDDEVVQAKKNLQISAIQQPKEVIFHETSAAYNFDEDMKRVSYEMYYNGQSPPLTVLDPIAWYKFVKAWRRGDFKKKK